MKVIEPIATIIENKLSELSVYQRIDRCSSVCYQRPAKATDEEARKFCQQMIEKKHFVPLEMAVVHLVMDFMFAEKFTDKKFIFVDQISDNEGIVTGSIRSFLEAGGHMSSVLRDHFLARNYFLFFGNPISWGDPLNVRFARENEIPWQHKHVAVRVICNRAISHQLVRHRPVSILQESQRYCRYTAERFEGEVSYIRPLWVDSFDARIHTPPQLWWWLTQMRDSEQAYKSLLNYGLSPQQARGVLPNDAKTELIMYASLPEWKHILNTDTMRCSKHADPEMQRIMLPLRDQFTAQYPEAGW